MSYIEEIQTLKYDLFVDYGIYGHYIVIHPIKLSSWIHEIEFGSKYRQDSSISKMYRGRDQLQILGMFFVESSYIKKDDTAIFCCKQSAESCARSLEKIAK